MIRDLLSAQLNFAHGVTLRNVDGITHDESLRQPAGGGSSLNWVLGHLLYARGGMLAMLGGEYAGHGKVKELYERGTSNIGPDSPCLTLEELLAEHGQVHAMLLERLAGIDESWFGEACPDLFDPEQPSTNGKKLATLVFHDAYHSGQCGALRRSLGKSGAIQ